MKWIRLGGIVVTAWALLAALDIIMGRFNEQITGKFKPAVEAIGIPLISHSFFALVTIPIILYTLTLQRRSLPKPILFAAHILGYMLTVVCAVAWWILFQPVFHTPVTHTNVITILTTQVYWNLWIYIVICGATLAFLHYQRLLAARAREADYRRGLAEAQLQVLKLQLQPHFLFNTLHSVSALLRDNPDAADNMIADLSALLRSSLESHSMNEVTVEEELKALDLYMNIQHMRFQDRLSFRLEVEPQAFGALMPHLLLQPLAENAIRHGIARRPTPGTLVIEIGRRKSALAISVRDNGPGCKEPNRIRYGIGLSNSKARLEALYGNNFIFDIQNLPDGFGVAIELPFHTRESTC